MDDESRRFGTCNSHDKRLADGDCGLFLRQMMESIKENGVWFT